MAARDRKTSRSGPKRDEPMTQQSERFKEAARELGCDDSEEAFDEALRKVAKSKKDDAKKANRRTED